MARVILIAYDGTQSLDVFGPAEVFAQARREAGKRADEVVLASAGGGSFLTASGFTVAARPLFGLRVGSRDTVLVAGGEEEGVRAAALNSALLAWLRRAARKARRIGSGCSGAFVLAAAGVLDGRRAATHWSAP